MKFYLFKNILFFFCLVFILNKNVIAQEKTEDIYFYIGDDFHKSTHVQWKTSAGQDSNNLRLEKSFRFNNDGTFKCNNIIVVFLDKKKYNTNACIVDGNKAQGNLKTLYLTLVKPTDRTSTRDEALDSIKKQAKIFNQNMDPHFLSHFEIIKTEKNTEKSIAVPYDKQTNIQYELNFDNDLLYKGEEPKDENKKRWYVTIRIVYFSNGLPPK